MHRKIITDNPKRTFGKLMRSLQSRANQTGDMFIVEMLEKFASPLGLTAKETRVIYPEEIGGEA